MPLQIIEAVRLAEMKMGRKIPEGVWMDVLSESYRKLSYIKKPVEYLPILFQNELFDY